MSTKRKVAVLVGSLRKGSYSRMIARALAEVAPGSLELQIIEIGELTLYNEDVEKAGAPAAWLDFRKRVKSADAVLFVTPEYNRGLPAVLKNAIDVGSRPYGQSAWDGKPTAIISVTIGSQGAILANHQLRQSLVFLNMPTLQQPEAYISSALSLFNDKGELINESTTEFLRLYG